MNPSFSHLPDGTPLPAGLPLPTITEHELSRHTAEAGIRAAALAEATGGDPVQIGAMMRYAQSMPPPQGQAQKTMIGGLTLHDMGLAVTVAHGTLISHPLAQAMTRELATMRLIMIFHDPIGTWNLLRTGEAKDLEALDMRAMEIAGAWTQRDMLMFAQYVASCQPQSTPEETPPGKLPGPPAVAAVA